MKKSNLWLYIFTTLICSFSAISICQSENFEIQMPDTYIDTGINIENRSDIFFETNWNDWFWLLFLWWQDSVIDHRNSPITLTISGNSIECKKQLRWYYSTNYWNFHPLPIDSETKISGSNVKFITWWLFYDCHNESTIYTWVYWYVKRGIWDLWNTQEIRAWVNQNHDWFKSQSPLQLVFGEWQRNRALSGNARDSLAKKSRFVANMAVYELVQIWIPDEYFDNTAIFSENVNEIYFNDAWNNWFWLFFLWTGITSPITYRIESKGHGTLSCSNQLNWYYTINFTDFWMFPLDENTLNTTKNYTGTIWVNLEWWLYYNCRSWNTPYKWVYWHIKWTYWFNSWNSHEIWAWIDGNWNRLNKSPLELIYSENFRNTGRSLSGNFHSSLVKNSFVQNRFFGDMWLSTWNNIPPVWTINNHHFYIEYADYISNDLKIYLKSSTIWSTGIVILTWFDSTWQFVTWFQKEVSFSNARSLYNFYWYTGLDFPYEEDMRTWTISVTISNSWQIRSKSINFAIQPGEPKITINQNTGCSTGITISATGSNNATLKYRINATWDLSCDNDSGYIVYTGPITFYNDNYNWRYICFQATNTWWISYAWHQITWIDNRGPALSQISGTIIECTDTEWTTTIEDIWCAGLPENNFYDLNWPLNIYTRNQWISPSTLQFTITYNYVVMSLDWTITLTDNFSNQNTQTISLTITDVLPTFLNNIDTQYYSGIISTTTEYWNVIDKFNVQEWSCRTGYLSGTLIWQCINATWSTIDNKILTIRPNENTHGDWTCTIKFMDNEWNSITWYVKFQIDTKAPTITITWPNSECLTWKSVTATIDETGTILYYMTGGTSCNNNWPYITWATNTKSFTINFNNESDNGKRICFKAIDLAEFVSYGSSDTITWIDRTPPSFEVTIQKNELSSELTEFEIYECDTWTLIITDVTLTWCAWLHETPYGRNGSFGTALQYEIYTWNYIWTQNVTIAVQDNLWQKETKNQNIIWKDQQITWDSEIRIGYLTQEWTWDIISVFNLTWRWACETITISTWEHYKATCEIINETWLKITPDEEEDTGWYCYVYFSDWDTIFTWMVNFGIRTKEYYISLDSTGGISTWHVKSHSNKNYVDYETWKVSLQLNDRNNNSIELNKELYTISDISWSFIQNKRPDTDNINIEISNIQVTGIDTEFDGDSNIQNKCSWRNYELIIDTWFITDPAWNPSNKTNILTDNIYMYWDYITLTGLSGWLIKTTPKTIRIKNWFTLNVLTRNEHNKWTGSITCISSTSCPWFSCNNTWLISNMNEIYNGISAEIIGESIVAPFYYSGTLQIDPLNTGKLLDNQNRERRTWCIIKLRDDKCGRQISFDIILRPTPIKAWKYWQEDYWTNTLWEALNEWNWDNWFLFFITRPDEWSFWNIQYNIKFAGNEVADEFYYITWSAIVGWYAEDLVIKRPTFNYASPRSYMFTFPPE